MNTYVEIIAYCVIYLQKVFTNTKKKKIVPGPQEQLSDGVLTWDLGLKFQNNNRNNSNNKNLSERKIVTDHNDDVIHGPEKHEPT